MAYPDLTPVSKMSKSILPPNGNPANVTTSSLPFGIYIDENYGWSEDQITAFKKGASEQVGYVYQKLGGDVLDLELVESQIYTAYEEATLEYSYLTNLHQSKNVLSKFLGGQTGSFNSDGQFTGTDISGSEHPELSFPRYSIGYAKSVGVGVSGIAMMNGTETVYSGSFETIPGTQDYDLQDIIANSTEFSGSVGSKRILIKKVYYKTTGASWNFYGYFGGLNVVGNLSTYGQYADDSTFEIIPVWQNKLQAMAYEDAIKTRISDYSYQLRNNKIRIMPNPSQSGARIFWFDFTIPNEAWKEDPQGGGDSGIGGINSINTMPFQNIPFDKINSMGKQWIRRFALAVAKEMLGYTRSKFANIPIPGDSVQLNGASLITEGKAEQKDLRDELTKALEETAYDKLAEKDASIADSASKVQNFIPNLIYVG